MKHLSIGLVFSCSLLLPQIATAQFGYDESAGYLYPHYIPGQECVVNQGPGGTLEGTAMGLVYPAFATLSEDQVADNLTALLNERYSSSPWLSIDSNFGRWLFAEAKERNINPLLIAAIGRQENGFGTTDQNHVVNGYNYFGMKDFGQSDPRIVDLPGSDYLGFTSPEAGMTYFLDKVQSNIFGPDRGLYVEVNNFYEYLGMHQAGQIKYPGESLGTFNGGMDGFDPSMDVYISWTTSDHPNNDYDGQLFNPGIYYTNSVNLVNDLTGESFSDIPSRSGEAPAGVGCASVGSGGSGLVSASGYSFPLAPQNQSVGGISVGQTTSTHHDNTPAYDLFSSDSADVYALYGGTPTRINTAFKGIQGCSSIQFYADDGFYYWYGHLKNVTVTEGQYIEAGTQMAQIADDRDYGSDCWGGAPHLHIDRGCVINGVPQSAGRDECRDPDFIPFLSNLYESLPAG